MTLYKSSGFFNLLLYFKLSTYLSTKLKLSTKLTMSYTAHLVWKTWAVGGGVVCGCDGFFIIECALQEHCAGVLASNTTTTAVFTNPKKILGTFIARGKRT